MSEGGDRSQGKGDYRLSDAEQQLLDQVTQAFHRQHKKVIVVLNVPGVVDTRWSKQVDGILLAYMPGQEAGRAVADVLSGDVNPSGKLAQTFPLHYRDVPSAKSFAGHDLDGDGLPDISYYNEGIYVGYRYYDTFHKPVAYPFGFGLSYTSFAYQQPSVVANTLNQQGATGQLQLAVTIENTGKRAGREAAEVYLSQPQNRLQKPAYELKSFAKTSRLDAGDSQQLTFNISADDLASFDPKRNEWIIEPGEYRAYIAPSSDLQGVQPVSFHVDKLIEVRHTTAGALALPDGVKISQVNSLVN